MIILIIVFVFQACISYLSLSNLKQSLLQDRMLEVKHIQETAYSAVMFYHDQATKGLMTDTAARQAARDTVRAMHYDNGNYFFIWTLEGTGIAHGTHPEWEGKTFINTPTATQYPVVSYMVNRVTDVSKSEAKEGYSYFKIQKPSGTTPADKIGYSRLFEPWGWTIGTGVYIDDIDTAFRAEALSILATSIALILVACLVTFMLGHDLARALGRLSNRVVSVAKGELEGDIPEIERRDEVGVMARALQVLRDTSKEVAELRLDQLTGLYSRKMLIDRLKQAMAFSSRSGNYGGLMIIDLDKFKTLNDTQGHDAGDMLLREVAQRLTACVRECDTVARLGGDEFVLLIIDIAQEEDEAAVAIERIGKKILASLNQPYHLGAYNHISTASVGITLFKGDGVSDAELLKQADLAMYKSKNSGRNACRFFDPHMETEIYERMSLEKDLRQAIAENQFQLYYQPQVGANGRVTGTEALIRWMHPQRGLMLPDEFIPLAEETRLILHLGKWVLETACAQLRVWASQPDMAKLTIAINISPAEFTQPHYVDQVLATLDQTGIDPRKLKLELTESMLLDDVEDVIVKMTTLKAKGIGFSLDDFGTGYSSLSYLKRLPLDQLKIDLSFVRDIMTDPDGATIARAILSLGQSLGLSVIAEGVEIAEQRDLLAKSGCDAFQGYFFSLPLPLEDFEKFAQKAI
ncbi:MAG: EAL domain-containing protein [Gallionella sp.]